MVKPVRLSIKGAGEAGNNAPTVDDLLGQVRDFVEVLQGVEKALSDDHTNQIIWRVTDAERENPISFELTPFATNPAIYVGARAERVEQITFEGLAALQKGNLRPPFFNDDTLAKARRIHRRVTNGLAGTAFSLDASLGIDSVSIDTTNARAVESGFLAEVTPAPIPYREYGSIEGFVTRAELDGYNRAILRFRDRLNGTEIKAIATGDAFQQIEALRLSDVWHGVRVRVHGTISYRSLGVIDGLNATGIEILDRADLPGIDDIVDPTFTGGLSAEEYLKELRLE